MKRLASAILLLLATSAFAADNGVVRHIAIGVFSNTRTKFRQWPITIDSKRTIKAPAISE